jgi:hypothetical protein
VRAGECSERSFCRLRAEPSLKRLRSDVGAGVSSPSFGRPLYGRVRRAHSPLFRLSLCLASLSSMVSRPGSIEGCLPWVAQRRTNIGFPHDRAPSWSRSAVRLGGSVAQPKLMESMKHRGGSPRRAAFLFRTMSVALSLPSALRSKAPSAVTMPRRLGSRGGCYRSESRELDRRS